MSEGGVTLAEALERARTAQQAGQLAEAERICRIILEQAPKQFDALHILGVVAAKQGRYQLAVGLIGEALRSNPGSAEALSNLGIALQGLDRFEEAFDCYRRALAIAPNSPEMLNNCGNTLRAMHRFEEAVACYDRALAIKPGYPEGWSNRGVALDAMRRPEDAVASFDRALALRPDYPTALNNRGAVLQNLQRPAEAIASFERAIALDPDYGDAQWNESLCRLLMGDFERGWRQYEWREKSEHRQFQRRRFAMPLWLGKEEIAGKTILLHAEQGFGDAIQFCRYAPMVAEKGATVILEVHAPLKRLMQSLAGVAQVADPGETVPDCDFHTPLMSLPLAFDTRVNTIPARIPYLAPDSQQAGAWRARLAALGGAKIGLVWAGNPRPHDPQSTLIDRKRSMRLPQLARLAGTPGAVFISLQKGDAAADALIPPAGLRLVDRTAELDDFADTAALVAGLDLVISVDTAVAHLAGALGRPVWLLNRFDTCWRWMLDRDDSPWYPTLRLFRQARFGDWDGVIARVAAELAPWCARHAGGNVGSIQEIPQNRDDRA